MRSVLDSQVSQTVRFLQIKRPWEVQSFFFVRSKTIRKGQVCFSLGEVKELLSEAYLKESAPRKGRALFVLIVLEGEVNFAIYTSILLLVSLSVFFVCCVIVDSNPVNYGMRITGTKGHVQNSKT